MIKVSKLHGDYTSIETVRLLSGWGDGMIKVSQLHGDSVINVHRNHQAFAGWGDGMIKVSK